MSWPISQDFNEAIQGGVTSFSDLDLKTGEVAVSPLGLPIPRSGNFADVYQITGKDGRKWAVKCFTRKVEGLQQRYAKIDEHLSKSKLPFGVRFNYLTEGIRIRGQWYPIVKMEWVEGFTLNEFVRNNFNKPTYLHALMQMWGKLTRRLRDAQMAHADIQHGNVLLVPGESLKKLGLKLIDYDGMWVPALAKQHSGEIGHPNFQHPLRLQERLYNGDVDRFPHLVIATALRATLVGGKAVWDQFDNGDNLLFKESDLRDVANAPVFKTLWNYRDKVLCALLGHLALASQQPLNKTPWLDELLFAEKGPQLSPKEESQVCNLLGVSPISKPLTASGPALPQAVQAEFNVFAHLDDDESDVEEVPSRSGRQSSVKASQSGRDKKSLLPLLIGGGIAFMVVVALTIAMSGGKKNPDPQPKEKELVQNTKIEEEPDPTIEIIMPRIVEPGKELAKINTPKENVTPIIGKKEEPIMLGKGASRKISEIKQTHLGEALKDRLVSLDFSPDHQKLIGTSATKCYVFDAKTLEEQSQFPLSEGKWRLPPQPIFVKEKSLFMVGGEDHDQIVELDWEKKEKIKSFALPKGPNEFITFFGVSADETRILTAHLGKGVVRLSDVKSGVLVKEIRCSVLQQGMSFRKLSPDLGSFLYQEVPSNRYAIWEVETNQKRVDLDLTNLHPSMRGFVYTSDGKCLIGSASPPAKNPLLPDQPSVVVWDPVTGKQAQTIRDGKPLNFNPITTPDNLVLLRTTVQTRVYDPYQGKILSELPYLGSMIHTAFSTDGTILIGQDITPKLTAWKLTYEPLPQMPTPEVEPLQLVKSFENLPKLYSHFSFSPDGKRVLAYDLQGSYRILEMNTGTEVKAGEVSLEAGQKLHSIILGNGDLLFVSKGIAEDELAVESWDWRLQKKMTDLESPQLKAKASHLTLLPVVEKLVLHPYLGSKLPTWNVNTGKLLKTLEFENYQLQKVHSGIDEKNLLLNGSKDKFVLWNQQENLAAVEFEVPVGSSVSGGLISPTGRWVAASLITNGKSRMQFWDGETGKLSDAPIDFPMNANGSFSSDGNYFLSLDQGRRQMFIYDVPKKRKNSAFTIPQSVVSFAFSPRENLLVTADRDKALQIWKFTPPSTTTTIVMEPKKEMPKVEPKKEGPGLLLTSGLLTSNPVKLLYTPDLSKLVVGTRTGTVYMLDPLTLKEQQTFEVLGSDLLDMVLIPKSGTGVNAIPESLVTLAEDGTMKSWNLEKGTLIKEFTIDKALNKGQVQNLLVTPDGLLIVLQEGNKTRVWNVRSGKELPTPLKMSVYGTLREVEFSREGKVGFTIGSSEKVAIFDPVKGVEVRSFDAGCNNLRNLRFSSDANNKFLIGSFGKVIVLYNYTSGKELRRIDAGLNFFDDLEVIPGQPRAVTYSGSSRNAALCVWDLKTGDEVIRWERRTRGTKLAISPDGKYAAIGDAQAVTIYQLPPPPDKK